MKKSPSKHIINQLITIVHHLAPVRKYQKNWPRTIRTTVPQLVHHHALTYKQQNIGRRFPWQINQMCTFSVFQHERDKVMITAKSTLIATIHVKYIFSCVTYVYSSTSRMLSNCELIFFIYLGKFSQRFMNLSHIACTSLSSFWNFLLAISTYCSTEE